MREKELAEAFTSAVQAGDFETVATFLTDDFQFFGATPQPLDAREWLGLSMMLKAAFPDLDYHFEVEEREGEKVFVSSHFTGTHTGDLDLTSMGLGVLPPTGISFSTARTKSWAVIRDGKIAAIHLQPVEGSGLPGILQQLGVELPPM